MTTPDPSHGNVWKVLVPVAAILVVVAGGSFALQDRFKSPGFGVGEKAADSAMAAEMRVGATLPEFELRAFRGASGRSPASKVELINFWATWCEACMAEMPSIVKLYNGYKGRGFNVVAIDVDQNPDSVLPRTIKKYGMPFTVYTDADSKLADFFQIQAIPLTVVIDRNRKILMIENEGVDWNGAEFRTTLDRWLAG